MGEYQAMLDATRDGHIKPESAVIPDDPLERANHLKGCGYYCNAAMVGICGIPDWAWRERPVQNPDADCLAEQVKT